MNPSSGIYVIAEVGINHNGDIGLAREMIDAAAEAGASCVKFQNFICDQYLSPIAGKAGYQQADARVSDQSQYEIIKACEITIDQTADLKAHAERIGIDFLSTPFELQSFRQLRDLGVFAVKISSCNLTNIPFLEEVAASGLPVLLSTGMGDMGEVCAAVDIFRRAGSELMLFQCTSNYPSRIENANLRVLETYRRMFGVPVGFSDHTIGNVAAVAAVALGAVSIEKHFTLSRSLPGIDQQASIEPSELRLLVEQANAANAALGSPYKSVADEEGDTRAALRRSLVAARDLVPGETLTSDLLSIKRPGTGLAPAFLPHLLGRRVARAVARDHLITLQDFQ